MHISSVYLSTYNENTLISGHMTVKIDGGEVQMEIPVDICHFLQNSLVGAWELRQRKLAEEILTKTPAFVALPAPSKDNIEDADFAEVKDEGVPF